MVFEKLSEIISVQFGLEKDQITRELSFADDLNADSLDLVELMMSIEDEFNCNAEDSDLGSIQTIGDVENLIREKTQLN